MNQSVKIFTFIVIFIFFLIFTSIPLWDPDFWWHINTGRYILDHRALPDEDPFTFTTMEGQTLRKTGILKGYWLSQIILYLIYWAGGVSGVILLRSFILILSLLLIYHFFLRKADPYFRLFCIVLTGSIFIYFTGERPQTLIFPLVILMFATLERHGHKGGKSILFLPFIIFLWSNMHGSVLFAIGIIIIYILATLVESFIKYPTKKDTRLFVVICLIAILTYLILSPVGIKQIIGFYQFQPSLLQRNSIEFASPIKAFLDYGQYLPYYWVSLIVIVSLIILAIKRLTIPTIMVMISTITLSLISARYMVFFILSTPLLFSQLNAGRDRISLLLRWSVLTLSVIILTTLVTSYLHPFNFRIRSTYPIDTVERLRDVEGLRIFTHLEWGGFVGYHIPGSKVFIDGRTLSEDIFVQYNAVIEGTEFKGQKEWEWILDRYMVNMVILPWRDLVTGMPLRIIKKLMVSKKWRVIFFNDNEVVFGRR
jgi:hypothetical protein